MTPGTAATDRPGHRFNRWPTSGPARISHGSRLTCPSNETIWSVLAGAAVPAGTGGHDAPGC
jgi:hypothetical protein